MNKKSQKKKHYIDLFGCVKNQVDAENLMAGLNLEGWAAAESAEEADLIIVNSCGFIESAKQESINAVLAWRKLYPTKKILLAGCLGERYAKELKTELPEADYIMGIGGIKEADSRPELRRLFRSGGAIDKSAAGAALAVGMRPLLSMPGTAYVKISEGCNNNCTYCAIPLIRGSLKSRSIKEIVRECEVLLGRGIRELCLIGQDTATYGADKAALADLAAGAGNAASDGLPALLAALSELKGNFHIRLLYMHPDHFPYEVLSLMEKDKRILPYFDFPFQHASEKILKAMGRKGNAKIYLKLIKDIRNKFKDAVIRSTFLTGFPGESEEDFMQLLDFQEKAKLTWLGCFVYSREEGTLAYNMKARVSKKLANDRKKKIEEAQLRITEAEMDKFVKRSIKNNVLYDVLIEEKIPPKSEEDTVIYLGRLPFQAPEVDSSAVILTEREDTELKLGEIYPCKIFARAGIDIKAALIN